jgi:hypothetical protein
MRCLNDVEIQAVADAEAEPARLSHAAECERCRSLVDARRREMTTLQQAASTGELSPAFQARMADALGRSHAPRGATTLRAASVSGRRRVTWISAATAAAAAAVVMFLILPKMGAPTSLSASEVLGRSLQTMTGAKGVELLEYDLFVAGSMAKAHRIEHLIDHDRAGRFRFSKYAADGSLEASIGHDPATGRRFLVVRESGQGMFINVAPGAAPNVSLPEVMQALIETGITMMQAAKDPTLSVRDTAGGRQYVVEMPTVPNRSSAAVVDLFSARAVVDAGDFRILEFDASGSILRQPYSMSFKLLRRTIRPSAEVSAEEFSAPVIPSDVVIDARADNDPMTDVLSAVVREVNRGRGR